MAILIKGMDFPKTCMACDLEIVDDEDYTTYCSLIYKGYTGKYREDGRLPACPLVEVDSDNLVDADRVIHTQVYDDEHEEVIDRSMTIADFLDAYTEEGCPMSVMDVEE